VGPEGGPPNPPVAAAGAPAPFVVGVPRSGTTLLRLMLDAHPALAVPPETQFAPAIIKACDDQEVSAERVMEILVAHPRWADLELDPEAVLGRWRAIEPLTAGDALRSIYVAYAERAGKPRWGDKSPPYLKYMLEIQGVLPEARFVHLIRDGRDVALSIRGLGLAPEGAAEAAAWWRDRVSHARALAPLVNHYLEVRFEDLVQEPERTLNRVCEFIELPWDPRMLDYHRSAADRLQSIDRPLAHKTGRLLLTGPQRLQLHTLTSEPPRTDRVGRWRREMPAPDRRAFEQVAGTLLGALGYEVGSPPDVQGKAGPAGEIAGASPRRSPPRIVMTLLVRDNEDVLEANLRYHLAQGVDFVVATDNGSRDGSLDILRRYERAGLLHLLHEPPVDDYQPLQPKWVTRMARLAATDFGADWVINDDADEFWWPVTGTLKDALGAIPDKYDLVAAPRPEFLLRPGNDGPFSERLTVREARSRTKHKVAHRGFRDVVVHSGSHFVERERTLPAKKAGPRRAFLGGRAGVYDQDEPLIPAPQWPIVVLHFPVRSYSQLARRLEIEPARSSKVTTDSGRSSSAGDLYSRLVADDSVVEEGLRKGTLVVDTRLRDFLRRCGDPVESGSTAGLSADEPAMPELSVDERRAELTAIQDDVMRTLAIRESELLEARAELNRRVDGLQRRLARARDRRASDRQRYENRLAAIKLERDKLSRRLEAANRENDELSRRLAKLENESWRLPRTLLARLASRTRRDSDS
jgi:hypothetical protein